MTDFNECALARLLTCMLLWPNIITVYLLDPVISFVLMEDVRKNQRAFHTTAMPADSMHACKRGIS